MHRPTMANQQLPRQSLRTGALSQGQQADPHSCLGRPRCRQKAVVDASARRAAAAAASATICPLANTHATSAAVRRARDAVTAAWATWHGTAVTSWDGVSSEPGARAPRGSGDVPVPIGLGEEAGTHGNSRAAPPLRGRKRSYAMHGSENMSTTVAAPKGERGSVGVAPPLPYSVYLPPWCRLPGVGGATKLVCASDRVGLRPPCAVQANPGPRATGVPTDFVAFCCHRKPVRAVVGAKKKRRVVMRYQTCGIKRSGAQAPP